jgi:NitT/TauT family transport system substrate-binding protein
MNRKCLACSMILLALVMALAGCGKHGASTSTGAKTKITICQWGQALIYLPFYIARDNGYFADEGLDVKVTNGGGDDLTWAAVTSGNAQFGIADPVMVAVQSEQGGVPGKVIGNVVGRVSFWAVTVDPKVKQISKPADFKGLRIACFKFPNTAHALALKTLKTGGLIPGTDAKLVEVNYEAVMAQLKNGEADVAMVLEPAASTAVNQGARVVYSYPKVYGPFAFTGLTTTQKYIDEHPEVCQKVVNAMERALQYIHSNPKGAVDVGRKEFPDLPAGVIKMAVDRMINEHTIPDHIAVEDAGWQQALRVAVDVKKLKKVYPTQEFVDNTFAEKAARVIRNNDKQ